jgi:hypothetical protein
LRAAATPTLRTASNSNFVRCFSPSPPRI